MKYLLAHDLGTTGDKATVFSEDGKLIASTTKSYPVYYGNTGEAEQDPEEWWEVVCDTTRQLLHSVDKKAIAAVSFSGQMMGCTCVDKNGKLLRRSIIWADIRSVEEKKELEAKYGGEAFFRKTCYGINPSYSITKLMWVKKHEPEVYKNTFKTLCCKDYIAYKLTGKFNTDHTDADLTLAYNLEGRKWAYDIMDAAGVDAEKFPEIIRSDEVVGEVTGKAAAECGLQAGTPVVMGCGDGPAGRVGCGIIKPGRTFTYAGTSAWTSVGVDKPIFDSRKRIFTNVNPDPEYCTSSGTMQAFGASINWMRDNLCGKEKAESLRTGENIFSYINENASKSPVGSNGLLFLPYLMGERAPHWNPKAKGTFVGLTMKHTTADMQRAVLEGVCMNLGLIYNIERENGARSEGLHKAIGGCVNSPIVAQSLADIYNTEIALTDMSDMATSMGAAILAGVGVGIFPNQDMSDRFLKVTKIIEPNPKNVEVFRQLLPVYLETYEKLIDVFERLN